MTTFLTEFQRIYAQNYVKFMRWKFWKKKSARFSAFQRIQLISYIILALSAHFLQNNGAETALTSRPGLYLVELHDIPVEAFVPCDFKEKMRILVKYYYEFLRFMTVKKLHHSFKENTLDVINKTSFEIHKP